MGAKPCLDCGSMNHGRCVRPQERPVACDGLHEHYDWFGSACWCGDAVEVAVARLRAVEAAAWAAVRAQVPDDSAEGSTGRIYDALLNLEGVLRTEGGAS